jgi:pimeloyl-ACP methyl ester carboxylesterase
MPTLARPDGVEIHFEERGSGPLVVMVSYWSMHPSVYAPLTEELESDRRVVRYDDRGTGRSTRTGPYDLDTAAGDLEALVENLGEPAVLVGTADGPARAIRVAAQRPDLIPGVVAIGAPPFGRAAFADSDTLAASEPVVQALLSQVETDYRGAIRTLVTSTNPQMSEDEVRQRVADQAEHCPVEAAAPRLRAWASDDAKEDSLAVGDRLWVIVSEAMAGGWFPAGGEMAAVVSRGLPEANVVDVEDGMVSRPDLSAAVIRGVPAAAAATAGDPNAVEAR